MTVNPTTTEIRKWLAANGHDPGSFGRVSAEKKDMCIASTEGYVPRDMNVVHYVNSVRKWMMDSGNGIERMQSIPPVWYRRYNSEHNVVDTVEDVLKDSVEDAVEMNEPNMADIKAIQAAEHEAHKVNQEKYTGTAFVTLQMNLQFSSLVTTALFEAHTALGRVFNQDGTPTETAYEDLLEVAGCMKQATTFLDSLTNSFRPASGPIVYELDSNSSLGKAIAMGLANVPLLPHNMAPSPDIGKRMNLVDHEEAGGMIIAYDLAARMYMIRLDDGTDHWLNRDEFNIID